MTYCLGIVLDAGLLLASDSRSNAGVDQIYLVKKLDIFDDAADRMIAVLSAGNLATTQSVLALLRAGIGGDIGERDLHRAPSMFAVSQIVGDTLRDVIARDGEHVVAHGGDPSASFLVAGQIRGDRHRLFQIYSAGNFVEASERTPFVQIGETKYGKPILDRALSSSTPLEQAALLALISFDATIRSNLSVEAPIDMLHYEADSFSAVNLMRFERDHPYWRDLRERYSDGLMKLVAGLPVPPQQSEAR
jgi:putative proteasome-type protease